MRTRANEGNRILLQQNTQQVIFVPARFETLALSATVGSLVLLEQVKAMCRRTARFSAL
jgi:hypothetical protein